MKISYTLMIQKEIEIDIEDGEDIDDAVQETVDQEIADLEDEGYTVCLESIENNP